MANKERKVKKVQARHILVGNKELAEKIKKKIDDGEEFSKLAEELASVHQRKGEETWAGLAKGRWYARLKWLLSQPMKEKSLDR